MVRTAARVGKVSVKPPRPRMETCRHPLVRDYRATEGCRLGLGLAGAVSVSSSRRVPGGRTLRLDRCGDLGPSVWQGLT